MITSNGAPATPEYIYKLLEETYTVAKETRDGLLQSGLDLMKGVQWDLMNDDLSLAQREASLQNESFMMVLHLKESRADVSVSAYENFQRSIVYLKHGLDLTAPQDALMHRKIVAMDGFIEYVYNDIIVGVSHSNKAFGSDSRVVH